MHHLRFSRLSLLLGTIVGVLAICCGGLQARMADDNRPPHSGPSVAAPEYCIAEHNIGKFVMAINNNGTFGVNYAQTAPIDCFTQQEVTSCEFPKGSNTVYMYGAAFWIGAVVGRDTLVSLGADGWTQAYEMHPAEGNLGRMIYRSTINPSSPAFDGAVSEQDYIAVYSDTCTNCVGNSLDFLDNRRHKPLNIEITQRSYAWSYAYAEDIILFDYGIKNIGQRRLDDVYMGIYVDADVTDQVNLTNQGGFDDDICGFRHTAPKTYLPSNCPPDSHVVNLAWIADNSGDLDTIVAPVPAVTATRIVRTPAENLGVSFNWWVGNQDATRDFGPQARETYRDLQTGGLGTPEGDRNKYHFLSNGEFDYDQAKTASISATDPVWLPPSPVIKNDVADGYDTRYLLSFGPFDIEPGQTLPLSFAYLAGEDLHRDPANVDNLNAGDWEAYYDGLWFDALDTNATWADWIYDNPGVDTDSDGYAGEFTLCNQGGDSTQLVDTVVDSSTVPFDTTIDTTFEFASADTIWDQGDGVPDFRGASPPPAPATYTSPISGLSGLRAEPYVGGVRIVWNGVVSENTRDVFSREIDFEGYRVYAGRDDRRSSYTLSASYDIEDYNKWEYDYTVDDYVLLESPYSLDELRATYGDGDTTWHPLNYTRQRPYVNPADPTEVLYFEPQDYNRSVLANYPNANTPIKKVFPDAVPPPTLNVDSIPDSVYNIHVTEDGFLKYYEYEYTIENLLPTVPYWINVTAFDYGSPRSGLASLETNPTILPVVTYPLESVDQVASENLKVYVYPNPYRNDADYVERGFEGRGENRARDRLRRIHFANLPPKCKISIFTLDGDLVREIEHDFSPDDPLANHDTWDLITRNTQLAVSGMYYWTVEDENGNVQIGKLVIIL
ncbi:hypothetical protein GF377_10900 [candidate division GN15 bacterium]|nr:hypothetical protein [candidate division GN15 bacterium]